MHNRSKKQLLTATNLDYVCVAAENYLIKSRVLQIERKFATIDITLKYQQILLLEISKANE